MNTKAFFLFSIVFLVVLNVCFGSNSRSDKNKHQNDRQSRQWLPAQVANSGATAVNNGAGGVANANSGSVNNGLLGHRVGRRGVYRAGGRPQVANSQATAVNNGAGGVANAVSGSKNNGR